MLTNWESSTPTTGGLLDETSVKNMSRMPSDEPGSVLLFLIHLKVPRAEMFMFLENKCVLRL